MAALQLIISAGDQSAPGRSVGPAPSAPTSCYRASQVQLPQNDNNHTKVCAYWVRSLTFVFIQCCQILDILSIIQI